MSTVTHQTNAARAAHLGAYSAPAERPPVCLSPAELVSLAEVGMREMDERISAKMQNQRRDLGVLTRLRELQAKLAKFSDGLDEDTDDKRGGEKGGEDAGATIRAREFHILKVEVQRAIDELPEQYKGVARSVLKTMSEKVRTEFDKTQAANMSETVSGAISDIETRQQAELAEINNLMSQKSNLVEMAKNLCTTLNAQQDFITKNPAR
jgi:ribosomal protein S20